MPDPVRYVGAIILVMCVACRAGGEESPRIAPPIVRGFIADGRLSWYRLEDDSAHVRVAIRSTFAVEKPDGVSTSACRVDNARGTNLAWWPRTAKVGSGHSWFCAVDVPPALSVSSVEKPFPITTLYRVPLRDYRPRPPGRHLEVREHWSDEVIDAEFGRAKEAHGHPDGAGYNEVGWCFPVDEAYYQLGRATGNLEPSRLYDKIGYDFVVVDANRLRIYVLAPEPVAYPFGSKSQYPKNLYVLDYEFRAARFDPYGPGAPRPPGKSYERTGWRWQCKTKRVVESEVSEPFQVVADGDRTMLITESGSLYAVPAEAAGVPNRLRNVGLRDGQIVQALISDDDHDGRTFAFTSRYWFEVKEPIEYHDFEMAPLKAADPLPTLLECAQAVRRHLQEREKSGGVTPVKVRE